MRALFLALALIPVLVSCSDTNLSNQRDPQNTIFESHTERYRFIENNCDTYPRMAVSLEQYCRNLQWNHANNNCAHATREKLFAEKCPGQTWNPEKVSEEIRGKLGVHVLCSVTDGDPSPTDLQAGRRYINFQYSVDPITIIPHSQFLAVIKQTSEGDQFQAEVSLMTNYPDGQVIARKTVTQTGLVEVSSLTPESRVSCDIQLR